MKVTLGKLSESIGALVEFSQTPMPPAQACKVRKVLKTVKAELETYGEVEKETAEKHKGIVKTAPNGMGYYDFGSSAVLAAYMEELKPAREVEVDIPGDTWTEDDLMKVASVKPAILEALEWLIPV